MKQSLISLVLLLLSLGTRAQKPLPDSLQKHIDSCLAILKDNSLYTTQVNWRKIIPLVYNKASNAATKADCFEALKIAFDALDDKHAAYYHYTDEYKLNNDALLSRYTDSIKAAWLSGPVIITRLINNIAYLRVPFMGVNKQKDIDERANALYTAVTTLQQQNPVGWIIDLRLNGGGNIRPMLAGLAPFFEDGVVSYYADYRGNLTDKASFKEGDFLMDGVKQAAIIHKTESLSTAKVAVLTGAGTASSGEITAAIFKQRKNTRLFGEHTAGLANATGGFVLGNDVYFLISTARITDKRKKALPELVKPDQLIKGNDAFHAPEKDIVVGAALKWLTQ